MISVCMATYNGEKFIIPQLQSILRQLGPEDEVIVADDGSTDHTLSLINSLCDPRIIILSPNRKKLKYTYGVISKVANNFYRAIKIAKGDTIYLSDQDDIWMNNKINLCEKFLDNVDMIIHEREDVNSSLEPITNFTHFRGKDPRHINLKTALMRPPFQGACMGFTRNVKNLLTEYYPLFCSTGISHDHALGFACWQILGKESIKFITDKLILYRRHGHNVSSTGEKSKYSLRFKLSYRLTVILLLLRLRCSRYRK